MRLKACLFTFFCLVCSQSFAEGFLPFHLADKDVQEATVSFQVLRTDGKWERCVGAFVSNEGHILTANHCLDQCSDGTSNPRSNRLQQCLAQIDGKKTLVDIKVTSHCSFQDHLKAASGFGFSKCKQFNDVAIVLPHLKFPHRSCLPLAPSYKDREAVYTVGHPLPSRRGKNDSDGRRLYASFGEIISSQSQCLMIQNSSASDRKKGINQPGTWVALSGLPSALLAGTIQTTVDLLPGSSGGPLVNEQGEVIAVASFIEGTKNDSLRECKGATFFSPIQGINPTVSQMSPGFNLAQLSCQ